MNYIDEAFHIDWDLHELGPRPVPTVIRRLSRSDFAKALVEGDLPANAELVDEDKAA